MSGEQDQLSTQKTNTRKTKPVQYRGFKRQELCHCCYTEGAVGDSGRPVLRTIVVPSRRCDGRTRQDGKGAFMVSVPVTKPCYISLRKGEFTHRPPVPSVGTSCSQGTLVGSVEVCIIRIDQITIGIRLVHVSVRDTRCRSKKRNGTAISLP